MVFMGKKERSCPYVVAKVVVCTLLRYGCGTFDCGHTQASDKPFHLLELEDGQFIAICDDCNKGEKVKETMCH